MKTSIALLVLVIAARAEAEVCKVKEDTLVFRPTFYEQFVQLMDTGRAEDAAQCCLRCTVDAGTKIAVQTKGPLMHTIKVLDGPSRECVGEISGDMLACD